MRRQLARSAWVLISCAAIVTVSLAWGRAHGPKWTIGRAVIVKLQQRMTMHPNLYLKLSLRNIGTPGRMPVRILGRWAANERVGRWGHSVWSGTGRGANGSRVGVPPGMILLGLFRREVNLNQTAILTVPLVRIGTPRQNIERLEVIVMTGASVTDHRFVQL